jgi:putative transposase
MSERHKILDQNALYYLTCTVIGWIDIFSRAVYKDIVISSFQYCRQHKGLKLYAYVIMTNHLHLIASAAEGFVLSHILRDFKKFTSKGIRDILLDEKQPESRREWMLNMFGYARRANAANEEFQLWKHENHPVELYSEAVKKQKLKYIHNNPVRAGFVFSPEDWKYSSASNYSEMESMMEIDYLW